MKNKYAIGTLVETRANVTTGDSSYAKVKNVIQTATGYEYRLEDNTTVEEQNIFAAYAPVTTRKKRQTKARNMPAPEVLEMQN